MGLPYSHPSPACEEYGNEGVQRPAAPHRCYPRRGPRPGARGPGPGPGVAPGARAEALGLDPLPPFPAKYYLRMPYTHWMPCTH